MADQTSQEQSETPSTEAPAATQEQEPQSPQEQHDQLAALLSNQDWQPKKAAEPKPEATTTEEAPAGDPPPETTEEVAPAPEATAETTETTDEPVDPDALPKGAKRPRFHNETDQVVAALKLSRPELSWAECEARVNGVQAKAESTPEQEAPDELIALRAELAEVATKLDESGANEGLNNTEIVALNRRQSELLADIKAEEKLRKFKAETTQRSAASAAEAHLAEQQKVAAETTKRFPTLADTDSALRKEADRLFDLHQGSKLMQAVDAPTQLAEMAAYNVAKAQAVANKTTIDVELAKLDATAAKPAAKPAASQPVAAVTKPKQPVPTASGAKTTQAPDKPKSEQEKFGETLNDPRAEQERLKALLY